MSVPQDGHRSIAHLVLDDADLVVDAMSTSVALGPWRGRTFLDLLNAEDRTRFAMALLETRRQGSGELRVRWHPEGTPLAVRLRLTRGARFVSVDVERVDSPSLQGGNHLENLGMVASQVSHDLKSLLSVILVNADLIGRATDNPQLVGDAASDIVEATARARELSEQILTYANPHSTAESTFDLGELVRGMCRLVEACTSAAAVMRIEVQDRTLPVVGRSVRLRQLIMNLVMNAAEGIENAVGSVTLDVRKVDVGAVTLAQSRAGGAPTPGQYVSLRVEDTGPGMDEATLQRIFDPFFSTKPDGHGVGLATVLEIVEEHEGALVVHSAIGRGTVFEVLLPLADEVAEASASSMWRDQLPELVGRTVLMVDDDELLCAATLRLLRAHGVKLLLAHNGLDGVELFTESRHAIDCVLLDMELPYVSGADVYDELRQLDASLPVVVASGWPRERLLGEPAVLGGKGLLLKPFTEAELVRVLAQAMGIAVRSVAPAVDG